MQEQGQLELNIILDSLLTILSQCYVIKEIFYMFKRDRSLLRSGCVIECQATQTLRPDVFHM